MVLMLSVYSAQFFADYSPIIGGTNQLTPPIPLLDALGWVVEESKHTVREGQGVIGNGDIKAISIRDAFRSDRR
jgi:hypothetical protein